MEKSGKKGMRRVRSPDKLTQIKIKEEKSSSETGSFDSYGRDGDEDQDSSSTSSFTDTRIKKNSLVWDTPSAKEESHKSAFSPYKPRTVLTNLQRGNIPTETVVVEPVNLTFHEKAGQGELLNSDFVAEAPPTSLNAMDEHGLSPLMWAAAYGQTATADLLIRKGVSVDLQGSESQTALQLAAANGHVEMIRLLLNSGTNVNHADEGGCKQFLGHGVGFHSVKEKVNSGGNYFRNGNTALMYAVFGNFPHAVNELLINGADLVPVNLNDDTALSIAVKKSSKEAQTVIENFLFGLLQP